MRTHMKRQCTANLPSQMLALEPRYLFDAAVVTTVADVTSEPAAAPPPAITADTTEAALVTNGSMNHPTDDTNRHNGITPTDWSNVNSPDVFDSNTTFAGYSWVSSTDGGAFLHGIGLGNDASNEGATQAITGLVIGQQYELSFEQSSGLSTWTTDGATGYWEVSFGEETQNAPTLSAINMNSWQSVSLFFTASATSQNLTFLAMSDDTSRVDLGLDGATLISTELGDVTDLVDDVQNNIPIPDPLPENSIQGSRPIGVIETNVEPGTVTFEIVASHPDGRVSTSLTAFAVDSETGAVTIANTEELDYESDSLEDQSFTLFVKVTENDEYFEYTELTIELGDVNEAPSIEPIADQTVVGNGNHLLKIELIAEDPDNNPEHPEWSTFVFSLGDDAPEGAEIVIEGEEDDLTYFFTWTPNEEDVDTNPNISIRVSDPLSNTLADTTQFSVTVTDLVDDVQSNIPIPNPLPENSIQGSRPIGVIETNADPDADITFELVESHPDGRESTSLTAFAVDSETGAVTIANTEELDYESDSLEDQSFTLFVKVTENDEYIEYTEVTIELGDVNEAPSIEPIADQTVVGNGNNLLKIELIAEDPDNNPEHPEWSTFVFSLGDDAPEGAEIVTEGEGDDLTYFFTWTPNQGDEDATISIRVSDPLSKTLTDTTQFFVTVNDPVNTINDSTNTGSTSESKSGEESGEEGEDSSEDEGEEGNEEGSKEGDSDPLAEGPAEPAEEDTQKEAEKTVAEIEALIAEDFSETKEAPGAGKPEAQQPQTRAAEIAEIMSIADKLAFQITQCNLPQAPSL